MRGQLAATGQGVALAAHCRDERETHPLAQVQRATRPHTGEPGIGGRDHHRQAQLPPDLGRRASGQER